MYKKLKSNLVCPSALHRKRQPIRTTLRFAPSAPLCCALRCADWALSRVPSFAARGKHPFKNTNQRRRKDNGETNKTVSGHSEVVSFTRGSSQQARLA